MLPQGLQALAVLLVLLPGFVSAPIMRMMSRKMQQTEFERVIEALIFSFFTYVLYVAIFGPLLPFEWTVPAANAPHYGVSLDRIRLISIVIIAVTLGFIWGFVRERDIVLQVLRRFGLTRRSSNESVWADVFLKFGGTVQVGLGDGSSVMGWLRQYAESGDERTLFLEKARWLSNEGEPQEVPGDGLLLLTEKAEIKYVMFLDEEQQ